MIERQEERKRERERERQRQRQRQRQRERERERDIHIYIYIYIDIYIYIYGDDVLAIYIYIYMAKASFSAYVLVKICLTLGKKVHFSTKKSTTIFGLPFCFFPFPFLASKWLKYAVFPCKKPKSRQKTRPLPYIFIYI